MKKIWILGLLIGLVIGYFIGSLIGVKRAEDSWKGMFSARVMNQAKARGEQIFTENITITIVNGEVENIKLTE